MREGFQAYRLTMSMSFRAAPAFAVCLWISGIVMAASGPALAYGTKLLVDAVVADDLGKAIWVAVFLAAAMGLSIANVFWYCNCVFPVLEKASGAASKRLVQLAGGTDGLRHFERPDYLDQVHRISEDRWRLSQPVNATAGMLRALTMIVATSVLLAQVHPALLLLVCLGALSLWFGSRGQKIESAAQEATSEPERLRRHLFEVGTASQSGKELRVFGLTDVLLKRHHKVSDEVLGKRNGATWKGTWYRMLDSLAATIGYVGAIGLVLLLAINGQATAGDVVLTIALAAQIGGAVATAVGYGTNFIWVIKTGKRLLWLERYAKEDRHTPTRPKAVPTKLNSGIELRDVAFKYVDEDDTQPERSVLAGVSVHLPAGKVVALVGENGAGKTTLIKLLCDFYRPSSGQILVDGVDLRDFYVADWRERVSAAFQDYATFELLAHETVGVGDLPRIDDRPAVSAALEKAGATAVLERLPEGLETQLGKSWDEGTDLSGGQWQRLALARGLMRDDPLLVVFDEPTAALDAQTEHALFERFAETAREGASRGTVTLLVSHRFSTVRIADLIVVLDGGLIREYGSHDELMAVDGLYAELYDLQSKAYR